MVENDNVKIPANKNLTKYPVKPSFHKGGKGRLLQIASPCEFVFENNLPPKLIIHYSHQTQNTITAIVVGLIMLKTLTIDMRLSFGTWLWFPLMILIYIILNKTRRKQIVIEIEKMKQIVVDHKKKQISIYGNIMNKSYWIGLKCGNHLPSILDGLKDHENIRVEEKALKGSELTFLYLLIALILIPFVIAIVLDWFL